MDGDGRLPVWGGLTWWLCRPPIRLGTVRVRAFSIPRGRAEGHFAASHAVCVLLWRVGWCSGLPASPFPAPTPACAPPAAATPVFNVCLVGDPSARTTDQRAGKPEKPHFLRVGDKAHFGAPAEAPVTISRSHASSAANTSSRVGSACCAAAGAARLFGETGKPA